MWALVDLVDPAGRRYDLDVLVITRAKAARKVSGFVLDRIIEEGPGYQDWLAQSETVPELRRRVRAYLVPQATSRERREQLVRAAIVRRAC